MKEDIETYNKNLMDIEELLMNLSIKLHKLLNNTKQELEIIN